MEKKRLTRSANKMLAGVCSGIAEYFDLDPTLVRVCYAALSIFCYGFPGLLLYLMLMLIMPASPSETSTRSNEASGPSASSKSSRTSRPEPEDVEFTNVKKEE